MRNLSVALAERGWDPEFLGFAPAVLTRQLHPLGLQQRVQVGVAFLPVLCVAASPSPPFNSPCMSSGVARDEFQL